MFSNAHTSLIYLPNKDCTNETSYYLHYQMMDIEPCEYNKQCETFAKYGYTQFFLYCFLSKKKSLNNNILRLAASVLDFQFIFFEIQSYVFNKHFYFNCADNYSFYQIILYFNASRFQSIFFSLQTASSLCLLQL